MGLLGVADLKTPQLIEDDEGIFMQVAVTTQYQCLADRAAVATGGLAPVAPVPPPPVPPPFHGAACADEDPLEVASDTAIDTPSPPSSPEVSPFWGSPNEGHVARVNLLQEERLQHLRALAAVDPPDYWTTS